MDKKLSLVLLLGLFSCRDSVYGDSYYKIVSVENVPNISARKYKICLDHPSELLYTHFYTDSLYSVGDSIKIGK